MGFFDSVIAERLIRKAKGSDRAAEQLLLIAAKYIRQGEPMPPQLGSYLADAIETAIKNPAKHDPYNAETGAALLVGLNLKRINRPTTGTDPYDVCGFMFDAMLTWEGAPKKIFMEGPDGTKIDVSPLSQAEAARLAAERFGISTSTAKRYYRDHIAEYVDSITADPPSTEDIAHYARLMEPES